MLKIVQARLQQYLNWELPDVHAEFRKGRGTRDQVANIHWITEKGRKFQKNSYLCFTEYTKTFHCVDHNKLWKNFKEQVIPNHLTVSWETYRQDKKQQLKLDMEQWTGSKLGKEHLKAVYCDPAYSTSMQGTSCEMPGSENHKLESRLLGEISTTSNMHVIPL